MRKPLMLGATLALVCGLAAPSSALLVEVSLDLEFEPGNPIGSATFDSVLGVFDTETGGPVDLNGASLDGELAVISFGEPEPIVTLATSGVVDPASEIGFVFTDTTPGSLAGTLVDLNPGDGEAEFLAYSLGNTSLGISTEPFSGVPGENQIALLGSLCGVVCGASLEFAFTVVPEPATFVLLAGSLAVLAAARRRGGSA